MKNGNVISTSSSPRKGVSVRVTIQASVVAKATATSVLAPTSSTVVTSTLYVSRLV